MSHISAPKRLGGLGLIGILISLVTAVCAHHVAGGELPSLITGVALSALNLTMWAFARKAPSRLSAFTAVMLGAQFLDHAVLATHSAPVGVMCGHEQVHCTASAPMTMNTNAMVIAHALATGFSVWMAHIVMRLIGVLSEFFARLITRIAVKPHIFVAHKAVFFASQQVLAIWHVIRAPRRGPPTKLALCA